MGICLFTQAPAYMFRMPFEGGCPHSRQFGREGMGSYHSCDGRPHGRQPGMEGKGGYHALTVHAVAYMFRGPFGCSLRIARICSSFAGRVREATVSESRACRFNVSNRLLSDF